MRLLASMFSILILLPTLLFADIINVPDDHETIQGAIEAAEDGDTVLVEPGEYVEYPNFEGKRITVAGLYLTTGDESHIAETIVDGNDEGRVFSFRSDEDEESILCGLTIRNGASTYGAGIYINGAAPTLRNLVIYSNHATRYGGGIYATHGSEPTLINVTLTDNSAEQAGGAIRTNDESTINMTNCIVWNNEPAELQDDLSITYSDVEDGYNGQGNIESNPRFVDADASDYSLADNSPCIDRGDPDSPESPDGSRNDMGALSFTHQPELAVAPEQLNFRTRVGMELERSFTIENVGAIPAHVTSISIEGEAPFEFEAIEEAIEIAPEEEYEVIVTFAPDEEGEFNSVIEIETDDPDNEVFEVALSGFAEPPIPQIMIDTETIDYREVALRVDSSVDLTISNGGDVTLIVEEITIGGEQADVIQISVDALEVEPDENQVVTVTATPGVLGQFNASLSISCNDPDQPEVNIDILGSAVLPDLHYAFTANTGTNHTILVREVTIDEEEFELGNEVGVFSPDNLCCGGVMWMGEQAGLIAWGDNEMTEAVDGMQEDEQMTFKLWDYVAEQEYVAEPEFIQNERINGDDIYHDDGLTILTLSVVHEEVVGFMMQLREGWNLCSAPMIPEDGDVTVLWRPVVEREHLAILKNQSGRFYVPAIPFSNMPPWDFRQGYQARLLEADSLLVVGEWADEDTAIPLRAGWNMVAYLPEQEVEAPDAFENVNDIMIIAKDVRGRFYVPAIPFSNMGNLSRGQGYQVNMSEESELVWNVPEQFMPGASPQEEVSHASEILITESNMSLLIQSLPNLPSDGVEITLQNGSGLIVGECKLIGEGPWGLAVWGDDPTTEDVDGAIDGELLDMQVWHKDQLVDARVTWIKGESGYVKDALSIAEINLSGSASVADEFMLSEPYPNPFNSSTKLSFSLIEDGFTELAIYDVGGRLVSTLLSQPLAAGHHRITFNAGSLPSGVFLAQLKSGGEVMNVKMLLLR